MGRDVTFCINCPSCGKRPHVTATIDDDGKILSGEGQKHDFKCIHCDVVFTISKKALEEYTNQFD